MKNQTGEIEECARATITVETSRRSKLGELLLAQKESRGINCSLVEEKWLLRKRTKISMDGSASEVDNFLRLVQALAA